MPAKLFPVILVAAMTLSACASGGDPASEAPVELKPGAYELVVTAGGLGSAVEHGDTDGKVCLSADGDDRNIDTIVRKQFALTEGCSHQPAERIGNAVSGKVACPIDPTAGVNFDYRGSVAAEALTISATMTSYAPADTSGAPSKQAIFAVPADLVAKRIGDCG